MTALEILFIAFIYFVEVLRLSEKITCYTTATCIVVRRIPGAWAYKIARCLYLPEFSNASQAIFYIVLAYNVESFPFDYPDKFTDHIQ